MLTKFRITSFLLFFLISYTLLFIKPCYAFPAFTADEGIYVIEANSGDVVLEQNADRPYVPASTTKLMTAYILTQYVDDLSQQVTVGPEVNDYGYSDSTAGLWEGEILSYFDLLNALLIPSGNDAAGTIAVNVGRIILNDPNADKDTAYNAFVDEMNKTAQEWGLVNTHFVNPHGRHSPDHFITPSEMAVIAIEAFKNEDIRKAASTPVYTLINSAGNPYNITNTNLTLFDTHTALNEQNQAVAVPNPLYTTLINAAKTGSADDGSRTFVYYSEQGDADLVGVIFNSTDTGIFTESKAIVEELSQNYSLTSFNEHNGYIDDFTLENVHYRDDNTLSVSADEFISTYTNNSEVENLTTEIRWDPIYIDDSGENLELVNTIEEDQKVGALLVLDNEEVIKTFPIYADNTINVKNFADFIVEHQIEFFTTILVFLLILFLIAYGVKKLLENKRIIKGVVHKSKF